MMKAVFPSDDVEPELLRAYLPERGFFVEVGAFDPVYQSQTLHLEQRGWDGLLIEPIPDRAKLFASRKAALIPVACGSRKQHGQSLPLYVAEAHSSLCYRAGPPISVPVVTLDSILAERQVDRVDFLSVDVEGAEVDVLDGLSTRYRPALILIEDHAENLTKHRAMRQRGYKRVRRTGLNSWYVPNEVSFPVSLYGRLQLLRKYYLSLPFRVAKGALYRTPLSRPADAPRRDRT